MGLAQNIWTCPKHFGTCRRTRHNNFTRYFCNFLLSSRFHRLDKYFIKKSMFKSSKLFIDQVLPSTPQIQGLHTFVRNRNTPRDEFIFYAKRLIRLVIEYALSFLPYDSIEINTPQGVSYSGKSCKVTKICGVSILRAGETMEAALTDVCKDIRIGKILIQTSPETGEPGLYYLR